MGGDTDETTYDNPTTVKLEKKLSKNEDNNFTIKGSRCWFNFSHPFGRFHRYVALVLMCLLGFGSYFCYDNPAALEDQIEDKLDLTKTKYSLLYSMYSWPNVILCFIGGFLVDRVFGIRLGTNIYMLITLIGQLCFATGVILNIFWIMIMGRFIFGIGAESLAVTQNNYAVLWFKGKELNMVFGLQLSFARIGSTVNFWVMEPIYLWVNKSYEGAECLGIVLFIAAVTCVFSMICSLFLGFLDQRAERILKREASATGETVRLTDVKDFKATFWLITVVCVAYYVAIFPFIGLAKGFFTTRFEMDNQEANSINSLIYLISGVASPLIGLLVDKMGKNITWIMGAVIITMLAHTLLAFTYVTPYLGVTLFGIAYSCLASSLWPLVALVIPEYQLGTAYGVCQSVQNLGLAIFSIVAGDIAENYGYTWLEIFFLLSLIVAFLSTVVLWVVDLKTGGTLNMTPATRKKLDLKEV